MAKAYWIGCIRKVFDPAKFDAYRALAQPALEAAGGRYIARGTPAKAYDLGVTERTVIIEFPSFERAQEFYNSPEYVAVRKLRAGAATAQFVVVEGS